MYKMGLIGKNISHSKSQEVYETLLKQKIEYSLLDFSSENKIPKLKDLLITIPYLSITNPYKKSFFEQVDKNVSEIAHLGIINCLKLESGEIIATNTDYLALQKELLPKMKAKNYILGDGSLSELLETLFKIYGSTYKVLSRKQNNLSLKNIILDKNSLIINACSRDYVLEPIQKSQATYWDLNYNNPVNDLIASESFFEVHDGKALLIEQAKYALSFWNL